MGFYRKADWPPRTYRKRRECARTISEFHQASCIPGDRGRRDRRSYAATTADHGTGSGRPSQQKYLSRSRHQPAHRRKSSGLDHGENRIEVATGACPSGVCCCRERSCGAAFDAALVSANCPNLVKASPLYESRRCKCTCRMKVCWSYSWSASWRVGSRVKSYKERALG